MICKWCSSVDIVILQTNYQNMTDIPIGWIIACKNCGLVSVIGVWGTKN